MCTRWLDKTTKRRNRAATVQRPSSPATSVPSKGQFILCYLTHMMSVIQQELKSSETFSLYASMRGFSRLHGNQI